MTLPHFEPPSPTRDRANARTRVLVAGYYGHGNIGDEAILHVMLEQLRTAVPGLSATVVSGDPRATERDHAVRSIHERDWPALIDAATETDAILLGGGGLFQDYFGADHSTFLTKEHWGLSYFFAFPMIATALRHPFMLYAVGVGPLHTNNGRRYARLAFERADRVTVRDTPSRDEAQRLGVDTTDVVITADPAYLIDSAPPDRVQSVLRASGVPEGAGPILAVSIRYWDIDVDPSVSEGHVATALDRFVEQQRARILFVPFQSGHEGQLTDDRGASERVRGRMRHADAAVVCDSDIDASDAQGLFGVVDLVLAMRLHAAILAANAATPVVALSYDAKVTNEMARLDLREYVVELTDVTADTLDERLTAAWRHRDAVRRRLQSVRPALRQEAARNTAIAVELLQAGPRQAVERSEELICLVDQALLLQTKRAAVHQTGVDFLRGELQVQAQELRQLNDRHATASRLLAERTGELIALATELRAAQSALAEQPGHRYRRLRRRATTGARLALHAARSSTASFARPAARLIGATYRALVPSRARVAFASALARELMTWEAYAFDRYKRRRLEVYGKDLSGIRAPGEPGLVSIVLPAFDGAFSIREAVDSVLGQTYVNFELIIVDDGSTDETPRIADEYADRDARVRVVHQDNRKLPCALSRGFRLARGEFLTWTSCDNRLKPFFLDKMVDCLRRHPDWDLAYANLDIIGEDGQALTNSDYFAPCQRPRGSDHVHLPETSAELNVLANNSIGAAFLYRSRVAHLVGDYSRFRFVNEDYDYWMRVNELMTVRHVDFDEPVYDYRFHSRSLTARWDDLDMLRNRERLMVFDDFRRDFCLLPLVWLIQKDSQPLGDALERAARAAGHMIYDDSYDLRDLPRVGVPLVYAQVTAGGTAAEISRDDLPSPALKVLIASSREPLPQPNGDWDLCCAVGPDTQRPRLNVDYQGWLGATDVANAIHAVDIRARSHHLQQVEAVVEGAEQPAMDASIVICTRRPSDRLLRAIRAAADQETARDYELLIVDNGPERVHAGLRTMLSQVRDRHNEARSDTIRLIACPLPGLSAARNAGLAEARGAIVCFLDDDAVPAPDWLESICDAFDAHPTAGVVGGHIALKVPEPPPDAIAPGWRKYWSDYVTDYEEYTAAEDWRQFPWGASWAARRKALLQIGGFRSQYGRTGDNFWGGEELVAACLIHRLGYDVATEPRASVVHDVDPDRFTLAHVRQTMAAGYRVGYRAGRDLYLPTASDQTSPLRQLVTRHVDPTVRSGRLRWIDAAFRKAAQTSVLVEELGDVWRRARRPIVDGRSRA